jgi:DNA-directed RNA polymerase specialized sigma24 family protein
MNKDIFYRDETLMQEIKVGNMFAFDKWYKAYSRKLYQFAFSLLKSKEESENIVQDVFLKLWENRNRMRKIHL